MRFRTNDRLHKFKCLVSWARINNLKILGIGTEFYSLSGRETEVIYLERNGKRISVDACDAYNLYWGPDARFVYGNYYWRTKETKQWYLGRMDWQRRNCGNVDLSLIELYDKYCEVTK